MNESHTFHYFIYSWIYLCIYSFIHLFSTKIQQEPTECQDTKNKKKAVLKIFHLWGGGIQTINIQQYSIMIAVKDIQVAKKVQMRHLCEFEG